MKLSRRNFLLGGTCLLTSPLFGFSKERVLAEAASLKFTVPSNEKSRSVDLSRFLACLAEVETGNDDTKVGPCGSRSRYQISLPAWKQHAPLQQKGSWKVPIGFHNCHGDLADLVALRHLLWLERNLLADYYTDPWMLAYAWKAGLYATLHMPAITFSSSHNYNYALRVANLYHDRSFRPALRITYTCSPANGQNRPEQIPPTPTI